MKESITRLLIECEHENSELALAILSKRNYWRGFELAYEVESIDEFKERFGSEVVCEYFGHRETKMVALDGARDAIRLGLTVLSPEDISLVEGCYERSFFDKEKSSVFNDYPEAFIKGESEPLF